MHRSMRVASVRKRCPRIRRVRWCVILVSVTPQMAYIPGSPSTPTPTTAMGPPKNGSTIQIVLRVWSETKLALSEPQACQSGQLDPFRANRDNQHHGGQQGVGQSPPSPVKFILASGFTGGYPPLAQLQGSMAFQCHSCRPR